MVFDIKSSLFIVGCFTERPDFFLQINNLLSCSEPYGSSGICLGITDTLTNNILQLFIRLLSLNKLNVDIIEAAPQFDISIVLRAMAKLNHIRSLYKALNCQGANGAL